MIVNPKHNDPRRDHKQECTVTVRSGETLVPPRSVFILVGHYYRLISVVAFVTGLVCSLACRKRPIVFTDEEGTVSVEK